jgi:hypothetical protein
LSFEIGIIPGTQPKPTVGFIPTIPFTEAGHTIEPSVSVPATTQRLAETAVPEPALDPMDYDPKYRILV